MKFRKPVPLDKEVLVRARITSENKRTFEGAAEIVLADGTVAVEGKGRYLKMSISTITEDDFEDEQWQIVDDEDDPAELELP
jgi:hypothetical protein